jgi:hypothetical protein
MSNLNFKLMKTKLLLLLVPVLILAVNLNAQVDPGTDNVTHEWTFDDGTANDQVGFGGGVLNGTTTIEDGELLIDEADEFVEMTASVISINTYTELSIATWFTTLDIADINTGYHMIWYFGGSEVDGLGGTANLGSNGIFLSPARGDDWCRTAISCGNIATPWTTENAAQIQPEIAFGGETWHIVTTVDDDSIKMYINGGESILSGGMDAFPDSKLANLSNEYAWIGRGGYSDDPNYWCKVDKLTMYNKALSDEEVLWLYQNPGGASGVNEIQSQPGLKVYESNGIIYVQNKDNVLINSVEIFDVTGRMVYQTNDFTGFIKHSLQSSIYVVKLRSNRGDYISKILIE